MTAPAGLSEYSIALPAGTLLVDQYTIVGVLGRPGGFGITYLAEDIRLDTLVAIKEFMPRELATRAPDRSTVVTHSGDQDNSFHRGLEQFLREARTVAKVHHPSVVRVRNYFEANATAYLVMDYLEGRTLTELLRERGGRLPPAEAVDILAHVLDGLDAAHTLKIYHRDVKPNNIYITSRGLPVLLDFGAARQATGVTGMSMTAVLTPGFAPIEQYGHRGQGPWTDVYATAAVLYYLITGVDPVPATERVGEEVDPMLAPADIDPDIAQPLSDAIMKALSMAARDRPQSATEFQVLLRAALAGEKALPTPAPDPLPPLPPDTGRVARIPSMATPVWTPPAPGVAAKASAPPPRPAPSRPPAGHSNVTSPAQRTPTKRRLGWPVLTAAGVAVSAIVVVSVYAAMGPGPKPDSTNLKKKDTSGLLRTDTVSSDSAKAQPPARDTTPKPPVIDPGETSVSTIALDPTSLTLAAGERRKVTAVAKSASGKPVPAATSIRWTSSTPSVAKVDGAGNVIGVLAGTATVTASSGGVSRQVSVTVVQRPRLAVFPTSVTFNVATGNVRPPTQTVDVNNSGGGTATGLGATVQYDATASGWLRVNPSTTTTPATIAIQAYPGALGVGRYSATILISSPTAENSPSSIPVTLVVTQGQAYDTVTRPPKPPEASPAVRFKAAAERAIQGLAGMLNAQDRSGVRRALGLEETDRIWRTVAGHSQLLATAKTVDADPRDSTAIFWVLITDRLTNAPLFNSEYKARFDPLPNNGLVFAGVDRSRP